MGVEKKSNKKILVSWAIGAITVVIMLCGFYQTLVLGNFSYVAEDGFLENFEVVLLAVACLTFLHYCFWKGIKYRAILAFFAFLFYSFIMRELDFENFGLDERIVFFFDGVGRNTIAVVVFTAIFLWAICTDFKGYFRKSLEITFSKWGMLMVLFLFFVALGQVFEKTLEGGTANLAEEILETAGYLGFAICAIDPLKYLKKHFEEKQA